MTPSTDVRRFSDTGSLLCITLYLKPLPCIELCIVPPVLLDDGKYKSWSIRFNALSCILRKTKYPQAVECLKLPKSIAVHTPMCVLF